MTASTNERGSTLVVGLVLLSLVTLLGLAGANAAHVERLLAQNETFRENAGSAASAGIEMAISAIVTSPAPESVAPSFNGQLPGSTDSWEVELRFAGYETTLPQAPGTTVAGAHFDIVSTGHSARNAIDRQRAAVMWVVPAPATVLPVDCAPLVARHCYAAGELERLAWQRIAAK